MCAFISDASRMIEQAGRLLRDMSPDDPARAAFGGLAEAARHLHSMFENAVQGMYEGTLDGRIVAANPAFAAMLGYASVEDMLPIDDFARRHYMEPERRASLVAELLEKGSVTNREVHLKRADGTPVWGLANIRLYRDSSGQERIDGVTVDITARKLAEQALESSEIRHRRILETAGEGFVYMDKDLVILEVNEASCRMVGRPREEILGRTPADLGTPDFREYLERNLERLLSSDYRTFEGTLLHADGHAVPVLIHGNTLRCEDGTAVGNVAFISDMTESKKALALASEVQRSLMPSGPPRAPALEVAGSSVPSQYAGGDYFDYLEDELATAGCFRAAVGDVTGHGLEAALLMTTARGFLRMRAAQPGSLLDVVRDLNAHLCRDTGQTGRFMTLMLMEICPDGGLGWVRAGHDPALLYDPETDAFRELGGRGMALGIILDAPFEEVRARALRPGQVLVIGTDGIWEARNALGEMFGKARLREAVRAKASRGAGAVLDEVFARLHEFAGISLEDDATLVVVRATG
ncbi:MAG: SpoIIE family protein phosphatase [Acidobacteriota bacterium]